MAAAAEAATGAEDHPNAIAHACSVAHLGGVGDGEAFALGRVTEVGHELRRDCDGLARGLGALQRDPDEAAIVHARLLLLAEL